MLRKLKALECNVSVVYMYYLKSGTIQYPSMVGCTLYIGEAQRISEPTGVRFRQHISPSAFSGADMGNNLALSQYFHQGHSIGLKIYSTGNRKDDERNLIYAHIKQYGSAPICQANIPCCPPRNRNRITDVYNYITENEVMINQCIDLLESNSATFSKY